MMIEFTEGNLLDSDVEALVNTVNTVGVMGKGVALMFKEAFPENFKAYEAACRAKELSVGRMFVTRRDAFLGPQWIVNFPTKAHWRYPSRIEWVESGLDDLKSVIVKNGIRSIALPPLGAGNGGLDWQEVRDLMMNKLRDLDGVRILVFEPTKKYQNVAKRTGLEKLTPARASIAELIRNYSILGLECSLVEVQKLGYFLERFNNKLGIKPFDFAFSPNRYGPYSEKLKHMLNGLDGSYLHCDRRLADAGAFDPIHFNDTKRDLVSLYMNTEGRSYLPSVEATARLIDGFESPLGMELLSTVDWLVCQERAKPNAASIRAMLADWPGGDDAGERKQRLFEDRIIEIALISLREAQLIPA